MAIIRPKNVPVANLKGVLTTNQLPSGSILQIKTNTNSTTTTIGSSTSIIIATQQITVSQGSTIKIDATVPWFSDQGASWNNCPNIQIYRDTTVVQALEHQGLYQVSGASSQQMSAIAIDRALAAGSYTYTIKLNHVLSNTGGTINRSPRYTQLTLTEISA